jgi:hypothetical protein
VKKINTNEIHSNNKERKLPIHKMEGKKVVGDLEGRSNSKTNLSLMTNVAHTFFYGAKPNLTFHFPRNP